MSWILASPSLNYSEAILNGTIVSANTSKWTLSDHHLPFAHDLYALYFVYTIVQGDTNKTENVYDKGYITIQPLQLVAIISGETEITKGNKQNIVLNGSESYDPHVGPGALETLTFYWFCKKSSEEFPTEKPLEIQVVYVPLNGSGLNGGCFGTGVGRLESTEPVVALNASVMENTTASYVFQLIVTKDARTSSDRKTVHVVEGSPPEVSLNFILNDRLNVIPSAPLTISADYLGYSCDDEVEYQWTLYEEGEDEEWAQISSNAGNSKVFTVDPNTLKDNTKYRLELIVLLSNATPSTSVQIFKTVILPRDGSCSITPDTGEAVYTSFELFCFGWFALNETFTYEVQIIGDGYIHYTLYYGLADKLQLVLPQGNASNGYLSYIKVFVSRSNGATSELDISVTVTPPGPKAEQDLFELLEKSASLFEEHLDTMDTHTAWQLMTAVLLTIETQALTKHNFFNQTVSTEQKSALRDIALKRFQLAELDDLPSVVFISAFLATAGKTVTELSFHSKDLLPTILGNLTDVLLSNARKMNAKDEKFIFQGVYNLLYGTVELLMVSANDAAVNGNTGLLSSDQLKAKDIVLESMGIVKTLLRTLAIRLAVSQSPKSLHVPGMDVMLGRETPCGLQEKRFNFTEDQSFELPQNMRQAFPNAEIEETEYQMIRTTFNPYRWDESHQQIKSEILSLEFSDTKGTVLRVGGNNIDIDIKIPLNTGKSLSNNFFIRPLMMRYHTLELTDVSDSMILEVKPTNLSLMMVVYVKKGERPTVNSYGYTAIVPDYSSCNWVNESGQFVAKCSRSPFEIISTADFNQTGTYYVGVLYIERGQLNSTRVRRSCFGRRRRKKRDCVEPKPPPVKGIEYNRTLTYNPTTDQNYSVKVRRYSCYYFSLTQDQWTKDGCKVGDDTNDQILQCRCNHLTAFGGGFVIAPNPIDFDKVFVEFTRLGETGNYVVLTTVCTIFAVYFLVLIWARKADMLDERKLGPTVHVTPTVNGTHTYYLTVTTGVWRNAGSTANVFIKIYGTEDILEAVDLTNSSPPGRKMFGRGSVDRFVIHLEKTLGNVIKIEMWHDNSGKNSSWFLDQVRLVDKATGEKWDFFHNNWLALHKGDGSTKVSLMSNDPNHHGPGLKNMFYSLSSVDLADYHLWASVITRPPRNPFTRVQRASCCLSLLYLAMACNAMFYQVTGVSDEVIQIGPLKMSLRQLIIGIESSLIVAPASVLITVLFRYRKGKTISNGENEEGKATKNSKSWAKRQCLLPHPFLYLGWFLCIAAIASSATVTVFYSLQWGKEIADQWLASVIVSCIKDVFIWQPCKVLFFTLVLIIIFSRPKSPDGVSNSIASSFTEEMKELRAYQLQRVTFFRFARQFGAFMVFYVLLMIVTYGDKDYHRYLMTKGTRDSFTYFDKANTGEKLWIYMLGKFIHDSYAGEWYNGQWERTPEYIGNKVSMLIGMPRLRQLRIKEDSCRVVKEFETIIDSCYDFYSMSEEDTTPLYLPHWIHLSDAQQGWANLSRLCPRPWRYSSPGELNNVPSWAQHHIYDGGGYVLDLGYDKPTAIRMMEGVKDKDWIDRRTRAVLLEFQVLNLNTNLMSIVTYHYEVLPFAFGLTYERIDSIKMFNFQNLSYSFYITCQLLFMLVVLVYAIILFVRLYRQRCHFFKLIWNWIDIAQIMSASLAIVFYIIKVKFMHDSIQELQRNPFVTVSFQFAIFSTEVENAALSLALFIATFKILHFIRLNPHVQILAWTIITAGKDILSFCALFGILFVAHAHFALLAFGSSVFSFSSFPRAFASEFELSLGNTIHVVEINDVNRVLGSLFTASFMLTLAVLLVNIFVSILDINLHDVKDDEEKVQEAFGMGKFIATFLFGFNRKTPEENTQK